MERMNILGWMNLWCIVSWVIVVPIFLPHYRLETLLGMAMPLGVTSFSLAQSERIFRRNPTLLTQYMITAFAGKMLIFGIYIVAVLMLLTVAPKPFIVSFTLYFVALHLFEAIRLRRILGVTG